MRQSGALFGSGAGHRPGAVRADSASLQARRTDRTVCDSDENIEENNSGVEYESWKIEDISKDKDNYEEDPLLKDAIELVTNAGYASTSLIKRNFKIDYNRAGRIIDLIEERGIISEYQGAKPRSVLTEKKKIDDDEDKKNEMTKIEQEAKPYTDDDKIINQEKMDDFYDNAKYFIYSILGIIILYWIIRWFMG